MKVKIKDLIENPFSENRCSEEKLEQLRQQYQNDGKFLELIEARLLEDGKYQVIDGHQKLKILREKGVEETDIIVKEMDKLESLKYFGKKRIRGDLIDFFMQGSRYKEMLDSGMTQEEIGKDEGISNKRVSAIIGRLKVPEKYRPSILASENFHASTIDEISSLNTPKAFQNVIEWCLVTRRTKEEVRNYIHSWEIEKLNTDPANFVFRIEENTFQALKEWAKDSVLPHTVQIVVIIPEHDNAISPRRAMDVMSNILLKEVLKKEKYL